MMKNETNLKLY